MLAALLSRQLVAGGQYVSKIHGNGGHKNGKRRVPTRCGGRGLHVIAQLLEVFLLLRQLLLDLQELRLLALSDRVILVGLLAALEGITVQAEGRRVSKGTIPPPLSPSLLTEAGRLGHYLPPVARGAPVSPADMARHVVMKVRRTAWLREALTMDCRYMFNSWGGCGDLALISFCRPGQEGPPWPPCCSCDGVQASK